jgi:peptide/nickel transport system substrate-binding protein/oligopeptide transport system substrate-binding protein
MAESIESEDGQNWTIKLKDGFTFHNGEPANAEAFLRGWNYAAYGPNATQVGFFFNKVEGYDELQGKKPKAEEMSGVKAVDDTTIEVTLKQPFS